MPALCGTRNLKRTARAEPLRDFAVRALAGDGILYSCRLGSGGKHEAYREGTAPWRGTCKGIPQRSGRDNFQVKVALQISDLDSFNLVQRQFFSGAVVQLGSPG
jgi:hypothetical protein